MGVPGLARDGLEEQEVGVPGVARLGLGEQEWAWEDLRLGGQEPAGRATSSSRFETPGFIKTYLSITGV